MSLNHGTATAKVFWLLYQIWHVIPVNERELILSDILLEKRFYEYFFNWGYDMRNCFYYFYYFQLTRTLINTKDVAENMTKILSESAANLNLEDSDMNDEEEEAKRQVRAAIPLHENLPKDAFVKKADPKIGKEFEFMTGTLGKSTHSHIESRTTKPVNENILKKFQSRVEEVESLRKIHTQVKNWIKRYKLVIIKLQLEDMQTRDKLVKEKRKLVGWESEAEPTEATKARLDEIAAEL